MLVSHEYKFIVGLPTKCGTNSMRNMAIAHARGSSRKKDELHEIKELRHRMDVPEGCEDYARAIIIRNPFSRIVSMYEYLRRNTWEWKYKDIMEWEDKWGRRRAFTQFLHMLIDEQVLAAEKTYGARKVHGKRPFIWTDTMSQLARFLGAQEAGVEFMWPEAEVRLLRLEDLASEWHGFLKEQGVPSELCDMWVPKKANATRGGQLHPTWRDYFKAPENRRLAFLFVGEDVDLPYVGGVGSAG